MVRGFWQRWLRRVRRPSNVSVPRPRTYRPSVEHLEERAVPAIITVTSTDDSIAVDGFITLREALTAANMNAVSGDAPAGQAGLDTIKFNIAGAPGTVHTIQLNTALPKITDAVFIDGYSQPGASANTLADGDNAFLAIELDGSLCAFGAGLAIGAGNSTVQGLVINRFKNDGIYITDNGGDTIRGNFIGTDPTGTLDRGNGGSGITILTLNNTVGGTAPKDRNLISGNSSHGVMVNGMTGNVIQGNYIGTNDSGNSDLGNSGDGVRLNDLSQITVGGTAAGAGNRIAFNDGQGVRLFNTLGPGKAILGNAIFSNGGLGIDINGDGVTPNDALDADNGPNGQQNFPVLTAAYADSVDTSVRGILDSKPNAVFRLEFFASPSADASGFGEGRQYLGFFNVTTDAQGRAAFTAFPTTVAVGTFITATATDSANSTSEFSSAIGVGTPASFVLGNSDHQVYINLDPNPGKFGFAKLVAPGIFQSIAAGVYGTARAPVVFGLGSDQKVYEARFDAKGAFLDGWGLVAPGAFQAIAVGSCGPDNKPMLFGLGTAAGGNKVYAARFDNQGHLVSGWFAVAPGSFSAIAVGNHGAFFSPEVFGISNGQVYAARFTGAGAFVDGWNLVAPGVFSTITVTNRVNGTLELVGVGQNGQTYAANLDSNGKLVNGWFAVNGGQPAAFSQVAAAGLGNGNAMVFGLGTDQLLYGRLLNSAGMPAGAWTKLSTTLFKALAAGSPSSQAKLYGVKTDGSVMVELFDAAGNVAAPFSLAELGFYSTVAVSAK